MSLFTARLQGTQEEMGAQHGAVVADEARRLLGFYTTMPERAIAGGEGPIGRLAIKGIATAMQARLGRSRPAELLARSRAFGKAAGLPMTQGLLALATMDSLQNTVALAARMQLGPFTQATMLRAAVPACSTIIAWGDATDDGELIFARNFDFPGVGVWDASPAFIVNAETGGQRYGFFATKGADTAVVTVVNEAGLVIAPHTRWHRDVTFGGAMIIDVIHQIARKAETLEDAIAIARSMPASSSWGVAIGSAREKSACVLELAGPHIEVVRPVQRGTAGSASTLVCTNHYRSRLTAAEIRGSRAWAIHSERRAKRLEVLADASLAAGKPLRMEDLARFLGDRVDPMTTEPRAMGAILAQAINVHAAVIKPASCRALVGIDAAPSCEGTWADLAWSWNGAPETWTVRERDDVAAPQTAAVRALHEAARAYEGSHDVPAARSAIERAVAAAPTDPSLRLSALWLALESKAPEHAVVHARVGLQHERDAYRRGQLLLWGSRAARRVDSAQSRTWLAELDAMPGADGVDELQAAAKRRWRGGVHLNLMMADAY
ncbi:MAG: hypothetical protein JO257_01945 [Deltaproteobacteria bacterium]|nr:hypothetical protein [Deltaproteobacteria bacterium]